MTEWAGDPREIQSRGGIEATPLGLESAPVRGVWYTAMPMDGRIASADSRLDFLSTIEPGPLTSAVDPWSLSAFLARVDSVMVGAPTLRWLLRGGHRWPHGNLPTWLLSRDRELATAAGPTTAPLVRRDGAVGAVLAEIEAAGRLMVWLSGVGDLAGRALTADRVDAVVVTVAPTVLGAGPALFDGSGLPLRRFRPAECRPLGGDAARLRWVRQR